MRVREQSSKIDFATKPFLSSVLIILFFSRLVFASEIFQIEFSKGRGELKTILLTGFGPFGEIKDNPSGRITPLVKSDVLRTCGNAMEMTAVVLPVHPGTLETTHFEQYETVVSVGVSGRKNIWVERYARNLYEDEGISRAIDSSRPKGEVIQGSFVPPSLEGKMGAFYAHLGDETSAGTYVCNETYYRLARSSSVKGYFIHIPNIDRTKDIALSKSLAQIACTLFAL